MLFSLRIIFTFIFLNKPSLTKIYTLSLHDALPIYALLRHDVRVTRVRPPGIVPAAWRRRSSAWNKIDGYVGRSEEHTSELQSRPHLVCRLLLEKKRCNRPWSHRERSRETLQRNGNE